MRYKKQDIERAQVLYEKLKSLKIRSEISVSELGGKCMRKLIKLGFDPTNPFALWPIMDALFYIVRKEKEFHLDSSKYNGLCIGLPMNTPFVLLKRGEKIQTPYLAVAKEFAHQQGYKKVKYIEYWYRGWIFSAFRKSDSKKVYIVVSDKMKVRLANKRESERIENEQENNNFQLWR